MHDSVKRNGPKTLTRFHWPQRWIRPNRNSWRAGNGRGRLILRRLVINGFRDWLADDFLVEVIAADLRQEAKDAP